MNKDINPFIKLISEEMIRLHNLITEGKEVYWSCRQLEFYRDLIINLNSPVFLNDDLIRTKGRII